MKNHLKTLLRLIQANADSTFLLSQGLTYSQISELFAEALRTQLIFHDGSQFRITEAGVGIIFDQPASEKYGMIGNWVAPDTRYSKPRIGLDAVFLPKFSESKF